MGPASSGGTGSGGTVFIPPGQPQVGATLGNIAQNFPQTPGATPAGVAYPQAQQFANQFLLPSGTTFDPTTAANEAQMAASMAASYAPTLFGQGVGGSSALGGAASGALPYASNVLNNAFSPLYGASISALQNNPYFAPAMAGAGQAAGIGGYGAGQLGNLASNVAGLAQNPMYGQLAGMAEANPYYPTAQAGAGAGAGYGAGGAQSLSNAGQSLLQSGFDPQSALFNRTQQQLLDQSNAVNAMSGVAGTPYGASVTSNALGNFDINWQNNQLNRQATAAGAASPLLQAAPGLAASSGALPSQAYLGQLGAISPFLNQQLQAGTTGLGSALPGFTGASGLAASSAAAPYSLYGSNIGQLLSALGQQNVAGVQGAAGLSSLLGGAGAGLINSQNLGGTAAGQLTSLAGQPYSTGTTMGTNALNALNQTTQLGNNQYQLPQQLMSDLMQYMGLGQSASQLSGQLGQMGVNQLGQTIGGVGPLLGGANSLFGGGGGGLFGSGAGGIIAPGTGLGAGINTNLLTGATSDIAGSGVAGPGLFGTLASFLPAS